MVGGHDVAGERAFHLVGVQLIGGKAAFDLVDLGHRRRRSQAVVFHHQLIGNRHHLSEHVSGLVGDPDVVAVALRHLRHAVSAFKQGQRQAHLRLHAHLLHELAACEQIEELI